MSQSPSAPTYAMPSVSTLGVSVKLPSTDRTKPSSSSVRSSRRAVGRARPTAVATSDRVIEGRSASKQPSTSSPRAKDSTKSGPEPLPAIWHSSDSFGPARLSEEASARAVGALGLVLGVLVRVVQHLVLGGQVGVHPVVPLLLAEVVLQVLHSCLELAAYGGEVDADQLVLVLDHPAVDDHGVHVTPLSLEGDVPVGVQYRERYRGLVVLDQHHIGLGVRLEPAEVVAAECSSTSPGRPVDDLLGA